MEWLKKKLRDYFGFSKAETNGVIVLLLLLITTLLVPQALKLYYGKTREVNHAQDIALLDSTLALFEAPRLQETPASHQLAQEKDRNKPLGRKTHPKKAYQPQSFDINTADMRQLTQLHGIGPVLSKRILKYSVLLGGFINQAQYQEIYGLQPAVIENLKKYTYIVPTFRPKQLNINTAQCEALAAHPYLTYQQAKNIVQYRAQHGPFATVEAVLACTLIDQATFKKVQPYLTVE